MHMQLWKIDYSFFAALHSAKKRIYVAFRELEMYIIMVDRENVPFLHHCTVLKKRVYAAFIELEMYIIMVDRENVPF